MFACDPVTVLLASSLGTLLVLVALTFLKCHSARLRYHLLSWVTLTLLVLPFWSLRWSVPVVDLGPWTVLVDSSLENGATEFQVQAMRPLWWIGLQRVVLGIWCFGVIWQFVRLLRTLTPSISFRSRVLNSRTRDLRRWLDGHPEKTLSVLADRVFVVQGIRVAQIGGMAGRRILLPEDAMSWDTRALATVLHHERIHLRSWDGWKSVLAGVVLALYWYHPLVRRVVKTQFTLREQACDENVVKGCQLDPIQYFQQVLSVVPTSDEKSPAFSSTSVVPAIGSADQLRERITWLTQTKTPVTTGRSKMLAALICLVPFLMVAWRIQWQPVSFAVDQEASQTTAGQSSVLIRVSRR